MLRCWIATVDFETRSRQKLKDVGSWRYSVCPSTDALCMGYALDRDTPRLWRRGDPDPADLFDALESGALFEAHNVYFEWAIWHNVMVPRYGWPELSLNRMVCTAAKAAVMCLPRALENAAFALKLPMQKGAAPKKLFGPRKPTKKDPREWIEEEDDPESYAKLYDYCVQDVETERCLSDELPALSPFERRVFMADLRINLRGIRIDVDLIQAALKVNARLNRELSSEICDVTDGAVMAATERDRILDWLDESGLEMAALTKETVEDALFHERLTKSQRRVLELRQEGGRSSVSKYEKFEMCRDGDVVRGLYLYFGANKHGRFSGKLIQPQNFPRGNTKGKKGEKAEALMERMVAAIKKSARRGDTEILRQGFWIEKSDVPGDPLSKRRLVPAPPAEVLSTALRGAFIPREGKAYGVGDYSAIEARMVFWLADERYGLKIYREGGDIYRDMGSDIFNKPPEELNEGFERMMGKTVILGCGYEMSWGKFKLTCKRNYGMVLSDQLCKKSVYGFRKRYKAVPDLWDGLNRAAKKCVRTGMETDYIHIGFRMDRKGTLRMMLPSGRDILFRHARLQGRRGDLVFINGNGHLDSTYGGKLTEYAASGLARDVMADAIVKAEFECDEIDPVMHSHDELVAEGEPGVVGKRVLSIMQDVPAWAKTIPMKIEAWESGRYHK